MGQLPSQCRALCAASVETRRFVRAQGSLYALRAFSLASRRFSDDSWLVLMLVDDFGWELMIFVC